MITLYHYRRPFHLGVREGFILKIDFSKRNVGWGEVAPLPGYSLESLEQAKRELLELLPNLRDNIDLTPYSPSVQFGVKSALSSQFDAPEIPPVPINGLLYLERLEKFDPSPYSTIKIKVGHLSSREAIRLMDLGKSRLISKKLRIDVNQAWSPEETLSFAESCPWMDLEYFEDPIENQDFPYPVAHDTLFRKGNAENAKPKALIYKPTLQCWDQAAIKKGVDFIFSSSYETELGLMQIAKLAYREKVPILPMGLGTYCLFKEPLFKEAVELKEGKLHFPNNWTFLEGKVNAIFRMSF